MPISVIFSFCVVAFIASAFLLLGKTAVDVRKAQTAKRLKALRGTPEAKSVAVTTELLTEADLPDFVPLRVREVLSQWMTSARQIIPIRTLIMISAGGSLATLILSVFAFHAPVLIALVVAVAASAILPFLALNMTRSAKSKKFLSLFPDGIDLMVRAIRAGLPISAAMESVGKEIADPVGQQYRLLVADTRVGYTFDEALKRAAERVQLMEFSFFTASLSLQNETGGNLAETLETLANVLRRRKEMRLKVNAITSEARTSAYVMAAIPFFVCGAIGLTSPGYIGPLFTDPRGGDILLAALFSMCFGFGIMQYMIKSAIK